MFLPFFVISGRPDLSRIGVRVGWFDWKNFACRTTSPSGCRTTFETNSLVHSSFSEVFGGGRGDMLTFSCETSSSLQSNNFWNQQAGSVS